MKKRQDYKEFVEKFKPKLTTDDCYTPTQVYDAVMKWAHKHLDIEGKRVVRPFYPGGDYEHFDYTDGCVVIDNPPFSIFSSVVKFYVDRGIPFFLFAPALTSIRNGCTFVGTGVSVVYENGAVVSTSFVTNMMGDLVCCSAPELYRMIKEAVDKTNNGKKKTLNKLSFPDCVLRATHLHSMSNAGVEFRVSKKDGRVTGNTCNVKDYGNSVLLSDKLTAQKLAAQKLAARPIQKLQLSETSKRIIAELNGLNNEEDSNEHARRRRSHAAELPAGRRETD